ncbi:MAG: bifunctional serine/threonine-protein kinase/formylglycine-generating enzyme family protein [Gemmataceae bacterium]|nr:bifunctional serine/threonine-protein kinase/formylglycine-generating enzyme family protein [Gemmataceae bacterium]MCS7269818.1 bifunctional serine/threonine-protein kinase/formylglycine-generating enzyme family protein [Gemmataceae bacterium]MDW8241594.1 bifunctional serine/threonine-protein kinase/formylglycine-generating enzyme family protein [Thermogemmata sp.]
MTSSDPVTLLFEQLRSSNLLRAQQLQELGMWIVARRPDVREVAAEVERRGWLTAFQLREVARGRARELVLGHYLLLDLLGEGGMGRVYKAQHLRLGRLCAIKVIRRERLTHPAVEERFRKEIEALGRMQHPNVVQVFNADQTGEVIYYEMELIDGSDLTRLVKQQGPLPIPEACEYIRQAALGLQHAHELGLVHRDIKPSNILVSRDKRQIKLVDMGLARILDDQSVGPEASKRITREGVVLGTPDFVAPEQARNPMAADIRADIYALGGTLYYLLTGRVPYEGANPTEKMLKHWMDPPPPLLPYRPDAPQALEQLIHWCMAKQPEQRPQTPIQLALALQPFSGVIGASHAGASKAANTGTTHSAGFGTAVTQPATNGVTLPPSSSQEPRSSQIFRLPADMVSAAPLRRRYSKLSWGLPAFVVLLVLLFVLLSPLLHQLTESQDTYQVPSEFTNTVSMRLVMVKPGEYRIGSPPEEQGRRSDEGPPHQVRLTRPFLMAVTETTNGQFQQVMGYVPSQSSKAAARSLALPVENVTWWEAVEFCRKLTEREQKEPWSRPGWGYRLPTEAEWEYAARAGAETPFAFGQLLQFGRQAIFKPEETDPYGVGGDMHRPPPLPEEVGRRVGNPFGLQDMHGNVAEWCHDWYSPTYGNNVQRRVDPVGPADGDRRVVRGGSFALPATACRSAARAALRPELRRPDVGFRVVYAPLLDK